MLTGLSPDMAPGEVLCTPDSAWTAQVRPRNSTLESMLLNLIPGSAWLCHSRRTKKKHKHQNLTFLSFSKNEE